MPVASRTNAEISVLLFPTNDMRRRTSEPLIISDVMTELVNPFGGDAPGITNENLNPNAAPGWWQQPNFTELPSGLDFVRLEESGRVVIGSLQRNNREGIGGGGGLGGFCLTPREAFLDCKIGPNSGTLDGGNTDLNFDIEIGEWETCLPISAPSRTQIWNLGTQATERARTRGTLPANRQFRFDVQFQGTGLASTTPPEFRIAWGSYYSLLFRDGKPPQLELLRVVDNGTQWVKLRTLPGKSVSFNDGAPHVGRVMRFAGRLCIEFDGRAIWWAEPDRSQEGNTTNSKNDFSKFKDAGWLEAPLQIFATGCSVIFGLAVIKYTAANGTRLTGSLARAKERYAPIPTEGDIFKKAGGYQPEAGSLTIEELLTETSGGYRVTLQGSADGIDTPICSTALLSQSATWENPEPSPIDFAMAVNSFDVVQEVPSLENPNACWTASVEIDAHMAYRVMKHEFPGLTDAQAKLKWHEYAADYRRIVIAVRWRLDTGQPETNIFVPIFHGYVMDTDDEAPGYNQFTRTLSCEDSTCLLKEPFACVDQQCPPIDMAYLRRIEGAFEYIEGVPQGNKQFFGWHAIKEIIEMFRGDYEADHLRIFLPPDHYPLLDATEDRCGYLPVVGALTGNIPTQNGFMFPAPMLQDAWTWAQQFCKLDRAVLFVGWPTDDRSVSPPLCYGRPDVYLAYSARRTWDVPDANYKDGDQNHLLQAMSAVTKSRNNFNHFLAISYFPGSNLGGGLPLARISEAYFAKNHPYSAYLTGKRTKVIETEIGWYGGPGRAGVDYLAQGVRDDVKDVEFIWPSCQMLGEPYMAPGDKFTLRQYKADGTPNPYSPLLGANGFSGQTMRIQQVRHSWQSGGEYQTTASLRPLLPTEV